LSAPEHTHRGRAARWAGGRGDGVADEDGCDGGGGGERFDVEDSAADRGAVQEQRQLLAELFGVGGAGLAGGIGEPAFLESLDMRALDAGGLETAYVLEWAGILLVGLARNGAGFEIALGAEVL
jgi:hypothetical protein